MGKKKQKNPKQKKSEMKPTCTRMMARETGGDSVMAMT